VHLYEEKIIGFIDILGWSELIKHSAENEHLLKSLDSVAALIAEISAFTPQINEVSHKIYKESPFKDDQWGDLKRVDLLATHFSDTLVFSASPNKEATSILVACVIGLTIKLLSAGYYIRGVITKGKLHHTSNSLYGPALISAYKMEQKNAIYPRVLVTSDVLEHLVAKEWVEKDRFDGMNFLNVLHFADEKCIATIEEELAVNMEKQALNLDVLQKLNWVRNYINNHKVKFV
jgi:hypothetical protein